MRHRYLLRFAAARGKTGGMLPLFLIVFVDLIGFGIMMPLLPYYATHFGASRQTTSLLFCMYSLGQFIASPFWGKLSDRIGRRPVMMTSMAGSVIAYIVIAFAPSLGVLLATGISYTRHFVSALSSCDGHCLQKFHVSDIIAQDSSYRHQSYAMAVLFIARLFAGLMAGNISAAMAYMADITTPETRAKGMGLIGAAFGLGFIFGPVIGGFLGGTDATNVNFTAPSLCAAALSGCALLAVLVKLKESLTPERRAFAVASPRPRRLDAAKAILGLPDLRKLIEVLFLVTTAMGMMETSFTIWIYHRFDWGPKQVSYIFAFIGIIMALIQGGGIGKLVKHFGERAMLSLGSLLLLAGLLILPFSPDITTMVIASSLLALGYGLSQPSFNSLISKEAKTEETGMVMGVSQSAGSLARVVGPALSSLGFVFGVSAPFLMAAALMLPALYLGARLRPAAATKTASGSPASLP